jgi:flagellar hook assembly protein FlgD
VRGSPNPFGASTSLTYAVPEHGRVLPGIYDAAGREVAVLVDRDEEPGLQAVRWDGTDSRAVRLPAGVYFGRLCLGGRQRASKTALID